MANDFVPFGTGTGANVESASAWAADTARLTGFTAGQAPSIKFNTALRQSSSVAAMVGQFISNYSGASAQDDGNISELETNFISGLSGALSGQLTHYAGVDTGATNAVVTTTSPSFSTIAVGTVIYFVPSHTCAGGAATITINGLGPYSITSPGGSATLPIAAYQAGCSTAAVYMGAGRVQLLNVAPAPATVGGTSTQSYTFLAGSVDAFAAGDPVFLDYNDGSLLNLNSAPTSLALTAGPATSSAIGSNNGAWPVFLADGTYILFTNSGNGLLMATRYSQAGVGLFSNTIIFNSGSPDTAPVGMTVLSTGNVAYLYDDRPNGYIRWVIMTPTLQVLYSGYTSGGATIYPVALVPLTNGGVLWIGQTFVNVISPTGVMTQVWKNSSASGYCQQTEQAVGMIFPSWLVYSQTAYVAGGSVIPIPISTGGYGLLASIGGSPPTLVYLQFNYDGTQRAAPITVGTLSSALGYSNLLRCSKDATTGNIAWTWTANTDLPYYGIISDAGAIVLAANSVSSISLAGSSNYPVYVMADGAGSFAMVYGPGVASGPTIYYMSTSGVAASGYTIAQTLASNAAGTVTVQGVYRLSTGIFVITSQGITATSVGTLSVQRITTSGAFSTPKFICNPQGYTWSAPAFSAIIYNDQIIGAVSAGGATNNYTSTYSAVIIGNSASISVSYVYQSAQWWTSTNIPSVIQMDASGTQFWVMVGKYYGLHNMSGASLVESYTSSTASAQASVTNLGQVFAVADTSYNSAYGGNLYFVKPRSTVMVGVAASITPAYQPLTVYTGGLFATRWTYSGTFTQQSNNPPGNAGWFANGLVYLKGF